MITARVEIIQARGLTDADGMTDAARDLADLATDLTRLARSPDTPGADRPPAVASRAETLPAFMERARSHAEPAWLVRELLPDEGVVIWHGRPRSMKSLTAGDVALSVALGEPRALASDRFVIDAPVSLLWLAEEDPARLTAFRLGLMLAARGIQPGQEPEGFRLVVRAGWNLEAPEGQAALLEALGQVQPALLVIDPMRASLPSIDAGPRDAAAARGFLLSILRETSVRVVWGIHHDTKPRADGRDERARAERASGGVTFSMADTLVNFERVDDRSCLAVPTAYKVGSDPRPFRVRFESGTASGAGFKGFLRAIGETAEEAAPARDRVLAWVRDNPWCSTTEVDRGAGIRTGEASRYLSQLEAGGLVRRMTGDEAKARGRKWNAVLWEAA